MFALSAFPNCVIKLFSKQPCFLKFVFIKCLSCPSVAALSVGYLEPRNSGPMGSEPTTLSRVPSFMPDAGQKIAVRGLRAAGNSVLPIFLVSVH